VTEPFDTLKGILDELKEIKVGLGDLISTTRFSRGGYDGPLISGADVRVGEKPVEIHSGAKFPAAVVVECIGTSGVPGSPDFIYFGTHEQQVRAGWRYPLNAPFTLSLGNVARFMVDRHQSLYAIADVFENLPGHIIRPGAMVMIRVYKSRL
jgi:hypothetical protein